MNIEEQKPNQQTTYMSTTSFLVLAVDGLRLIDLKEGKQCYGLINSAISDLFGLMGAGKLAFDIKISILLRKTVISRNEIDFLAAISLLGQYNDTHCRITCIGCYGNLLSAVHKVQSIQSSQSMQSMQSTQFSQSMQSSQSTHSVQIVQ